MGRILIHTTAFVTSVIFVAFVVNLWPVEVMTLP